MANKKQSDEMVAQPPKTPLDLDPISRLTDLVGELLKRDNEVQSTMMSMFERVIDTNALDKVLVTGLGEVSTSIAAQTAPLRALGREYKPLKDDPAARLDALNVALSRQDFSMITDQGAIRALPRNDRSYAS